MWNAYKALDEAENSLSIIRVFGAHFFLSSKSGISAVSLCLAKNRFLLQSSLNLHSLPPDLW